MKYGNEIKNGYLWSFLSPVLISIFISFAVAIVNLLEHGLAKSISAFFLTLLVSGFLSIIYSGVLTLLLGIPAFFLLKILNKTNSVYLTLIGGIIAFIFSLYDNTANSYIVLSVFYGCASGYFFWLGSTKSNKSSNKSFNTDSPDDRPTKQAARRPAG